MIEIAFAVALLLIGLWLISLNWWTFYQTHVRKTQAFSWIPLLGGLAAWSGLSLLQGPMSSIGWMALLLDWGGFPGIAHAIWIHYVSMKSKE